MSARAVTATVPYLDLRGLIADDLCRVVLIAGIGLAEVEQADLVALLVTNTTAGERSP